MSAHLIQLHVPEPLWNGAVVAWQGGSPARKPSQISGAEAGVGKFLFCQQVAIYFRHWGAYPDRDTMRIFYRRARMDAHATFRDSQS